MKAILSLHLLQDLKNNNDLDLLLFWWFLMADLKTTIARQTQPHYTGFTFMWSYVPCIFHDFTKTSYNAIVISLVNVVYKEKGIFQTFLPCQTLEIHTKTRKQINFPVFRHWAIRDYFWRDFPPGMISVVYYRLLDVSKRGTRQYATTQVAVGGRSVVYFWRCKMWDYSFHSHCYIIMPPLFWF